MISPQVTPFFDKKTKTFSYVVTDPNSRRCAVIDPVLDFDPSSGGTTHVSSDVIVDYILDHSLDNQWILETHAHADHLSAAVYLQDHVGGEIVIGENITEVQRIFGRLFNVEEGFSINGSQFDRLLADGDQLIIGSLSLTAIYIVYAGLRFRPLRFPRWRRSDALSFGPKIIQIARRHPGLCMP